MLEKLKKLYGKLSFERQLLLSFFSLSALLLCLALSSMLYFNLNRQRDEIDKSISNIAAYTATMEPVVYMLELGYPTETAERDLDLVYQNFSDLSVLDIYDTNGLRFYHSDRQKSGETVLAGEEKAVLEGSEPYITSGIGSNGMQRRAFHAVKNAKGDIIGFVTASVFTNYITDQAKTLITVCLGILVCMLFASGFLVNLVVRMLRSSLLGHHPQELLDLYLKQDTVLNAMEEGIVASDLNGTVIFANQSAQKLLFDGEEMLGHPITTAFPASEAKIVLETGVPTSNRSFQQGKRFLVYGEVPIGAGKDIQGVLTIVNDRSEIEALSDELSGAKSMLDTLRAFNHEFLNKLHVILGYLQTGETEKAITFIINSNLVSSQAIRQTADCIRVSQICALVIGKMMHAAELGILLSVTQDSRCMKKDLLLPMDTYITIIGNLLENAIEELSGCEKELKEITLGLYLSEDCSIITCEDTGNGIPQHVLQNICKKGVSSKGEGRGTGLYLINQLLELHGGEIHIDTEEGEGSLFTITITRKEVAACIE
ncbi:MAG: Spo0B domain-containing protein [Lachnospiraceae bacterium]|nr:Spo0B domain-containing protein [Lachnospiraceae bacterium]